MPRILDHAQALSRLRAAHRIAILGATVHAEKAAHYVPAYLREQGYEVIPVNPVYAGQELFGRPVLASLDDVDGHLDIIDVFRRATDLPAHLPEFLRVAPSLVWFQLGIRHHGVATALVEAGIDVVQDRCTLADLKAAGGRAAAPTGETPPGFD